MPWIGWEASGSLSGRNDERAATAVVIAAMPSTQPASRPTTAPRPRADSSMRMAAITGSGLMAIPTA